MERAAAEKCGWLRTAVCVPAPAEPAAPERKAWSALVARDGAPSVTPRRSPDSGLTDETTAQRAPQQRALGSTRGGGQQASISHVPFLYGINMSV